MIGQGLDNEEKHFDIGSEKDVLANVLESMDTIVIAH